MTRVTSGVTTNARRKKITDYTKGFRGRSKNCRRVAVEKYEKALQYAYAHRRTKKRDFRSLWIQRINAAVREHGLTYSEFMNYLKKMNIEIDRKILSDLAIKNSESFLKIVEKAKTQIVNKVS